MSRTARRPRGGAGVAFTAVLMALLIASSCGGSGPSTPPAPTPPGVPTPPPTPPPPREPPVVGTPCPGVVVRADPPSRNGEAASATLVIEWDRGSGGSFDWSQPYYDEGEGPPALMEALEVHVAEWRIATTATVTRHTLEIEWPPFLDVGLLFRSDRGVCDSPALRCGLTGCELGA